MDLDDPATLNTEDAMMPVILQITSNDNSKKDEVTSIDDRGSRTTRKAKKDYHAMVTTTSKKKVKSEPDPYCIVCKKYVKEGDSAVVCESCNAYVHCSCEGIDEDTVAMMGNVDFVCQLHAKKSKKEEVISKPKNEMVKDPGKIEFRYQELKAAYKRSEDEKRDLGGKFRDLKKELLVLQQIMPDYEKAKEEASKLQKALDSKKSCTQQEHLAKEELKIAKEHNKVLKEQIVNCKLVQKQLNEKYETLQKSSKVIQQHNDEMIAEVRKHKEENKQLINHQVALRSTNAELKEKVESAVAPVVNDNEIEKKMSQQLREKSKEISSLKENCKQYEEKLQSLVTELMSKERVVTHLCESMDTLKFVNKQLELKLSEFTNTENEQLDEESRISCEKAKTNNYTEKQK